jgi:hypothetical protein
MDTRTLVIGQKVSMTKSGIYGEWGEVVEVKLGHSFVKDKRPVVAATARRAVLSVIVVSAISRTGNRPAHGNRSTLLFRRQIPRS